MPEGQKVASIPVKEYRGSWKLRPQVDGSRLKNLGIIISYVAFWSLCGFIPSLSQLYANQFLL